MSQNKKFSLILIVFVILPLVILYLIGLLSGRGTLDLDTTASNRILSTGLFTSIIASIVIVILNARSERPKSYWYSIPITFAIVLLLLFYFGYSLSNFGF